MTTTTAWVEMRQLTEEERSTRWARWTAPARPRAECPKCEFPLAQVQGVTDGVVCMVCETVYCIGSERVQ